MPNAKQAKSGASKQWLQLDLQELPVWPAPAQWLFCSLVAMVLFGLAYWLWLLPLEQRLTLQRQTETILLAKVEQGILAQRQRVPELLAPTRTRLTTPSGANETEPVPPWTDTTLMRSLSEWQSQDGTPVDVMQMKPLKTFRQNKQRYLSMQLVLEGEFVSLGQYLQNLLIAYPNIRIASLNIKHANNSASSRAVLRASITLYALTKRQVSRAQLAPDNVLQLGVTR